MAERKDVSRIARRDFIRRVVGTTAVALGGSLIPTSGELFGPGIMRAALAASPTAYDGLRDLHGDLHAHSRISGDAANGEEPEDFYYQARIGGLLDFGALTDHAERGWWALGTCRTGINTDCGMNWSRIQQAAAANYFPDDSIHSAPFFTTIIGYEYTNGTQSGTSPLPGQGHRTVLFRAEAPAVQVPGCLAYTLSPETDDPDGLPDGWVGSPDPCPSGDWERSPENRLWSRLASWRDQNPADRDFLTFAHHPYGGAQSYSFDLPGAQQAAYQPLFEIYSKWGSSEVKQGQDFAKVGDYCVPVNRDASPLRTAREVLSRSLTDLDFRVGFVASTETHRSPGPRQGGCGYRTPEQPGGSFGLTRFYKGGWTGVWATKNSRSAIWDALKQRRCYATTGVRLALQFTIAPEWGTASLAMGRGWDQTVDIPKTQFRRGVTFGVVVNAQAADPATKIKRIEVVRIRAGSGTIAEQIYKRDNINLSSYDTGIQTDRASASYPDQDLAYYARITLNDDGLADDWQWPNASATNQWEERAWSSPIWVRWNSRL